MDSTRAGTLDCSSVSIVETIGQVHIAGRLKLGEAAIKKIFQLRKKKNTGCAIILVELMCKMCNVPEVGAKVQYLEEQLTSISSSRHKYFSLTCAHVIR